MEDEQRNEQEQKNDEQMEDLEVSGDEAEDVKGGLGHRGGDNPVES